MALGKFIDAIGEKIFDINWYFTTERPIRKSMKKVNRYMDEAIGSLEMAMNTISKETCENRFKEDVATSEQCDSLQASLVELYKKKHPDEKMNFIISEVIRIQKIGENELDESLASECCETMEQFRACVASGREMIILEGEVYNLWKYFARAATKRKVSQTINVKGDWNVTFGYGEDMVILSTPYKGENTIGVYRIEMNSVLKPAWQLAVDDDLVRKNVFDFLLGDVIYNDSVKREALTKSEERKFLKFVQQDEHFCRYYDAIFILFNTGLRIGEFSGLTLSDLNFTDRTIKVDHQLQRASGVGIQVVDTTKSDSGNRILPMSDEVAECFENMIRNRNAPRVEPMIDGRTGFLFFNGNGKPFVGENWAKVFQAITEKYNATYRVQIRKVTPHVCRHTYCSNMAKAGVSPKALQYLMGHADVSITLNTYTHIKYEDAKEEIGNLQKQADLE